MCVQLGYELSTVFWSNCRCTQIAAENSSSQLTPNLHDAVAEPSLSCFYSNFVKLVILKLESRFTTYHREGGDAESRPGTLSRGDLQEFSLAEHKPPSPLTYSPHQLGCPAWLCCKGTGNK